MGCWQFVRSYQQVWWLSLFTAVFGLLLVFSLLFPESEASRFTALPEP